jgi:putative membrane protein
MRNNALRLSVPLGLLLLIGSACDSSDRNVARDQSAAASAETPPDTGAPGAESGTPAATPKGFTDANFVAILDEANKADSTAGAVALKKATNPEVKAFARLMMAEHHALRVAGQALAKQLGVQPQPPERNPLAGYVQTEMNELKKAPKGPEFDRTYIDHEVSVHSAVLDFANQARVTTQTPELRELIEKAIPVVRKHLEQAQELQKQLTPAA